MKKDEYRKALLIQLDIIFANVSRLKNLSRILDNEWGVGPQEQSDIINKTLKKCVK